MAGTTRKAESGPDGPAPDLQLVVVGPETMATISLPDRAEMDIGRAPNAGVCVSDTLVSRLHARLRIGADGIEIEDLGSANGTKIGSRILHKETSALHPGETVTVGSTILMLQRLPRFARARRIWPHAYFLGVSHMTRQSRGSFQG